MDIVELDLGIQCEHDGRSHAVNYQGQQFEGYFFLAQETVNAGVDPQQRYHKAKPAHDILS
jgi:hypothetical protein